jgi:hypothetical protein
LQGCFGFYTGTAAFIFTGSVVGVSFVGPSPRIIYVPGRDSDLPLPVDGAVVRLVAAVASRTSAGAGTLHGRRKDAACAASTVVVAGSPRASEVESLPAAVASNFLIDANHTHADHAIKGHADDIGHSFSWAHLVLRFKSLWGLSTEARVDLTLARPPTDLSVTPGNSTPVSITIQSKHMKHYYSIKAHEA